MKPEDKDPSKSVDGGETSKSKEESGSTIQEPQPSTSSTFPNSPESSQNLDSAVKDGLFEVWQTKFRS